MAQSKYEVTYIISTTLDEESKTALVNRYDGILKDNGAEVIDSKDWSKRRLAYEINDFKDGFYQLVTINSEDAASGQEFDRLAKISEDVIRHMIVRLDEA